MLLRERWHILLRSLATPTLDQSQLLSSLRAALNKVVILEPRSWPLVEKDEPDGAEEEDAEGDERHLKVDGHHHEATRVAKALQARVLIVRHLDLRGRVEAHDGLDREAEGQCCHKQR